MISTVRHYDGCGSERRAAELRYLLSTQAMVMQLKLQNTLSFLLSEPPNGRAVCFRGASFLGRAANGMNPLNCFHCEPRDLKDVSLEASSQNSSQSRAAASHHCALCPPPPPPQSPPPGGVGLGALARASRPVPARHGRGGIRARRRRHSARRAPRSVPSCARVPLPHGRDVDVGSRDARGDGRGAARPAAESLSASWS
jgi:hypothetical protein